MYRNVEALSQQQLNGLTVVNFGTNWCSYCQAAEPLINAVVAQYPGIEHIKVEDGKGKRLGRLFKIKLWPTLIFLKDGIEIERLVRPVNTKEVENAFELLHRG